MTIADPVGSAKDKSSEKNEVNIRELGTGAAFRQTEGSDGEMSAENLGTLLRQVSKTSIAEIDKLISELQTLRRKLQTDGDRIQRDIEAYGLSQQVMQLTTIITDSVKKLPGLSGRKIIRPNPCVTAAT
jgi:hypothetical protein